MIVPEKLPEDIHEASYIYIALAEGFGKEFSFVDLHIKSKEIGLPHPHLSITRLRDEVILVVVGEGRFAWKQTLSKP